jgi:DNA-binding response OmpR family regulator
MPQAGVSFSREPEEFQRTHPAGERSPGSNSGTILIVEDDKKTASLIALYLEREGFHTLTAYDGRQALELARRRQPIFIVLDLMLPHIDGWEVCQELRRSSEVPILIVSGRDEELDRILGLSLGADDYVSKPFSPRELVARVKAIRRRVRPRFGGSERLLSHAALVLDPERRTVTLSGQQLSLTPSEYKLLKTLMAAPGRVFFRDELLNTLYPRGEAVIDRVIDVHVNKLRQKIEEDSSRPKFILTVRGMGYQFSAGGSSS